jgi:hypothetical protein
VTGKKPETGPDCNRTIGYGYVFFVLLPVSHTSVKNLRKSGSPDVYKSSQKWSQPTAGRRHAYLVPADGVYFRSFRDHPGCRIVDWYLFCEKCILRISGTGRQIQRISGTGRPTPILRISGTGRPTKNCKTGRYHFCGRSILRKSGTGRLA